jgi:hypothetical protein
VVLEVLADARQRMRDRNAERRQVVGIADAGELQDVRRADHAAGEHGFARRAHGLGAAAALDLDADGATSFQQHAAHMRLRQHAQVRPPQGRLQERGRRAGAQPALAGLLVEENRTRVGGRVRIVAIGEPLRDTGGDDRFAQFGRIEQARDAKRPFAAAPFVAAAFPALGAAEMPKRVGKTPAAVAELRPMIEIAGDRPHIEQSVDCTRSTQPLAAREQDRAIAGRRLRLGAQLPRQLRVIEQPQETCRNARQRVPVGTARFHQHDAYARIIGEAVRQHAAGRAGSDDHIVGFVQHAGLLDAVAGSAYGREARRCHGGACAGGRQAGAPNGRPATMSGIKNARATTVAYTIRPGPH